MARGKLLSALLGTATLSAATTAVAASQAGATIELSDADRDTGETQINDLVERAHAEGVTEGKKQGATDERARYAAVLGTDEAKANMGLALHLLSTTDMNAEAIGGSLKASGPAAAAPAPAGAPAGGGQQAVLDPIAAETGIVETGRSGNVGGDGTVEGAGMDEKQIAGMWTEAFGSTGGVTAGGVWGGLLGQPAAPARAN